MAASIWLNGGSTEWVVTLGTLEAEVEIAQDPVGIHGGQERGDQELRHDLTYPSVATNLTPLRERFANTIDEHDEGLNRRVCEVRIR